MLLFLMMLFNQNEENGTRNMENKKSIVRKFR